MNTPLLIAAGRLLQDGKLYTHRSIVRLIKIATPHSETIAKEVILDLRKVHALIPYKGGGYLYDAGPLNARLKFDLVYSS